jgi:lipopolysaccharide export LptBFGC system permease protein LptF
LYSKNTWRRDVRKFGMGLLVYQACVLVYSIIGHFKVNTSFPYIAAYFLPGIVGLICVLISMLRGRKKEEK